MSTVEPRNTVGAPMGAEPATFPLALALLYGVRVSDGSKTYSVADVDADFVHVRGAKFLLPVRELVGETAHVNVGQRVERYLKQKVDATRHAEIVAAATVVAAVVGYPRKGKTGRRPEGPLDRVWTDHIALANGDRPDDAWEISADKAPVSEHIRRKHGRIKYWIEKR